MSFNYFGKSPILVISAILATINTGAFAAGDRGFDPSKLGGGLELERSAASNGRVSASAEDDRIQLGSEYRRESVKPPGATVEIRDGSAAPNAYDPDKDPAFQKALRQYLKDQGIDRPFSVESIARSKQQTFGLENPCTNRTGEALATCAAERVCTTADGSEGLYMNVVVDHGTEFSTSWGEPMCVSVAEAGEADEVIELPTFTLQDFRTLNVAPAVSGVQPAPDTLKGMHTNVYAWAQPQQFATELGGFPVQVRAVPVQYLWDYGDGSALGPTELSGGPLEPGAWDVQTDTSHVYTQTGDYAVVLTTFFYGEYSVAGGPWLPVAGLNEVTSAPVPISVWKAMVRNYADDCLENPAGVGC